MNTTEGVEMEDLVTGATTTVEMAVGLPPERVWELVTAVERIGAWSPECVWASWIDPAGAGGSDRHEPAPGDRFQARNEYASGFTTTVECVVTEAVRPRTFAWVVLDDQADPKRPGAIWHYELRPDGDGTVIAHTFIHGPGSTGLRMRTLNDPDRTAEVIAGRLAQLHHHMTETITAMTS
jgi:hypothetical protein